MLFTTNTAGHIIVRLLFLLLLVLARMAIIARIVT